MHERCVVRGEVGLRAGEKEAGEFEEEGAQRGDIEGEDAIGASKRSSELLLSS